MRLCEALKCSPLELDDMDPQFVADAIVVLKYDAELNKPKENLGRPR